MSFHDREAMEYMMEELGMTREEAAVSLREDELAEQFREKLAQLRKAEDAERERRELKLVSAERVRICKELRAVVEEAEEIFRWNEGSELVVRREVLLEALDRICSVEEA
jgi:hypothetical protein